MKNGAKQEEVIGKSDTELQGICLIAVSHKMIQACFFQAQKTWTYLVLYFNHMPKEHVFAKLNFSTKMCLSAILRLNWFNGY